MFEATVEELAAQLDPPYDILQEEEIQNLERAADWLESRLNR